MGRMYSRAKGKSGSTKPTRPSKPSWVSYSAKELEMVIVKLAKDGNGPSTIGMILRDTYGVPDVVPILSKSVTQVMKEKDCMPVLPEDLLSLIKRFAQIQKHFKGNHKDMTALRGKQLTQAKISRLVKYYKRENVLPQDWKYDAASIQMLSLIHI